MDRERTAARARAALEASERLLRAPGGRELDPTVRAELGRRLDELRRLLAALEGGGEPGGGRRARMARARRGRLNGFSTRPGGGA